MKIQLDTKEKIIRVEDSINLKDLFEFLEKSLPDWKEYKLETQTIINWTNPIIIDRNPWVWPSPQPWETSTICDTSGTITDRTYVYNLEIN